MQRGYVKLWRKSLDSGLLQNHKLWVFWSWCLMKATHKRTKQPVGMQVINLEPGQFVFGRKKAAAETGLSERNVRTCINALKKLENLTIKATNKFSVITIVNWDTYQQEPQASDQQSDQQVTSKRPASDHKQEHKNIRNNIYSRVVDYLNRKTGKNFKATTKSTKQKIDARLNEGYEPEDFKTVIDNKVDDYKKEKFEFEYLRPETLFGNKFEAYLNQTPVKPVNESPEDIRKRYGLAS